MKLKLSKTFLRLIVWGLVAFLVGFFAAQFFSGEAPDDSGVNLIESGKKMTMTKERSVNLLIFAAVIVVIASLIAYGYYVEKKKR